MTEMTLHEVLAKGHAVLVRELGPVGYVRFLQQFTTGRGDHTAERQQLTATLSLDDLLRRLPQVRRDEIA